MFNKTLYNRAFFDRSAVEIVGELTGNIFSSGDVTLDLVVIVPIYPEAMVGSSSLFPGVVPRIDSGIGVESIGEMVLSEMVLKLPIGADIFGSGELEDPVAVKTPFEVDFSGDSALSSERDYVVQFIEGDILSEGGFVLDAVVKTALGVEEEPLVLAGSSSLEEDGFIFSAPLEIGFDGEANVLLRRLSDLDEETLQLIGINLPPGGSIIVDTDLLSVFLNGIEDVSSVTTDSVFFELGPGDNEVSILTDEEEQTLRVTPIWQNRWL